jgi:hypothetical protein
MPCITERRKWQQSFAARRESYEVSIDTLDLNKALQCMAIQRDIEPLRIRAEIVI